MLKKDLSIGVALLSTRVRILERRWVGTESNIYYIYGYR